MSTKYLEGNQSGYLKQIASMLPLGQVHVRDIELAGGACSMIRSLLGFSRMGFRLIQESGFKDTIIITGPDGLSKMDARGVFLLTNATTVSKKTIVNYCL